MICPESIGPVRGLYSPDDQRACIVVLDSRTSAAFELNLAGES